MSALSIPRSTTTVVPLAHVLVVDDESELLMSLCQMLAAEGYATTGVRSGEEALDKLRSASREAAGRFDVLVTDLMMPGMDGITLLRAAAKIDKDLVSIIMTGYGALDTAVEAMQAGALDYILKPFRLDIVMPVLARARDIRKLRMENAALVAQLTRRGAELEAANRELTRANKELEAFSHSVSHDVRQPLNGVIGFSELLLTEKVGALTDLQKQYLTDIALSGHRLLRLTKDLLQFSRVSHQPLTRERVDLTTIVSDIARSCRQAEPDRKIELYVGELPEALADGSLIRQVFLNLVSNAFKFTRYAENARIEVTGQEMPDAVSYRVRDNGAGFDMSQSERLFSIFQRLHRESEFEGTGVGLSIVHRIIERHGGTIVAEGAVGKGATFTITLPA